MGTGWSYGYGCLEAVGKTEHQAKNYGRNDNSKNPGPVAVGFNFFLTVFSNHLDLRNGSVNWQALQATKGLSGGRRAQEPGR